MNKFLSTIVLSLLTLNLSAQITSPAVKVAWDASPDIYITGYKLYLNTNHLISLDRLEYDIPLASFGLDVTNSLYATAFDVNAVESEPSNSLLIYRPIAPFALISSKQGNSAYNIVWAANQNENVNAYYIYLGTNLNNLNLISTNIGRLNNSYTIYNSNLLAGVTNFVSVLALNDTNKNILKSPLSTNLNIVLPPRPPGNLRISVIIQSSTNLISWNSVTNYEYLADSSLPFEVFRAKLEIEKSSELIN